MATKNPRKCNLSLLHRDRPHRCLHQEYAGSGSRASRARQRPSLGSSWRTGRYGRHSGLPRQRRIVMGDRSGISGGRRLPGRLTPDHARPRNLHHRHDCIIQVRTSFDSYLEGDPLSAHSHAGQQPLLRNHCPVLTPSLQWVRERAE